MIFLQSSSLAGKPLSARSEISPQRLNVLPYHDPLHGSPNPLADNSSKDHLKVEPSSPHPEAETSESLVMHQQKR